MEGSHRVQGTDSDLMDGETEGDTVVIAGQPEVLSTQAMQVIYTVVSHTTLKHCYHVNASFSSLFFYICRNICVAFPVFLGRE